MDEERRFSLQCSQGSWTLLQWHQSERSGYWFPVATFASGASELAHDVLAALEHTCSNLAVEQEARRPFRPPRPDPSLRYA